MKRRSRILLTVASSVLALEMLLPPAALAAGPVLTCSNTDCVSEVTITSSAANTCQVDWKYDRYDVPIGYTPKLLWILKPDHSARDTYSFDPSEGISLHRDDENDPNQDLNDNATDGVPGAFRWMEVHTRPTLKTIRFKLVVSGTSSGRSFACTPFGSPRDEYIGKIVNQ